jgi:hypothetical protein
VGLFGGSKRLETKLRQSGRSATADVSDAKRTHWLNSSGGQAIGGQNTTVTWRLRLHVRPDSEAPFDAKLIEAVPLGEAISVGQSMAVLYDPNDHSKVAIDHGSQAGIANFEAGLSPVATQAIDDAGAGPAVQNLMPEEASDPTALPARWKPDSDGQVTSFRREMSAHPSAGAPALADVSRAPVARAPQEMPEDRLAKLADLRDRGALTAAEFKKQKKQILGG